MRSLLSRRFLLVSLFVIAPLSAGSACDSSDGPGLVGANPAGNGGSTSNIGRNSGMPNQGDSQQTQGQDTTGRNTTPVNGPVECGAVTCDAGSSCVDGVCAEDGALRISLVWDSKIDLDLHVRTPSGEELYYRNREGSKGGRFAKDGCLADRCPDDTGPNIETVLWRGDVAPPGMYEVWGVNYDGTEAVTFRIDIIQNGMVKDSFSGTVAAQAGASSTKNSVCIGKTVNDDDCSQAPDDAAECLKQLDQRGINWEPWGYSTQSANGKQCTVEDPVRIRGPLNGITYKYYNASSSSSMSMSCPLAMKLYDFGNILKSKGITTALHIGTFNCRTIAGSSNLSQHAHGYAIDLYGFVGADGTRYILEEDWEHDTSNPTKAEGKVLYQIAQEAYAQKVFNTILTPNYNSAHDNHFHVDLKPGNNYMAYFVPETYLGNELEQWEHACPND